MLINKSRYLREDLKDVIDPIIQRNVFYAHPENCRDKWWKKTHFGTRTTQINASKGQ